MSTLVSLIEVSREFQTGMNTVKALQNVSLEIERGRFYIIMGPSGAGKSTLLHLIALLDRPTSGQIMIEGENTTTMDDNTVSSLLARIGIVFQKFSLFPHTTASGNVEMGLAPLDKLVVEGRAIKLDKKTRKEIAEQSLEFVGLSERKNHRPTELSGGEQQRVAIARAMAKKPYFIIADEPTGNLDQEKASEILDLFKKAKMTEGLTVIMVTHNPDFIDYLRDINPVLIKMQDGRIESISEV